MKRTVFFLFVLGVLSISGCKKSSDNVHTADWYKAHDSERIEMIKKCEANPGELAATPNCINATSAQADATWESDEGIQVPAPQKTA